MIQKKNNSAIQAHISPGNSMELKLADFGSGHSKIPVKNTNGYLGYKVGMILTFENVDTNANSNYILKNDGTIKINGEKSIGIQIFAPGSPSKVTVSNTGTGGKGIFMGGIESYGMKWSSRVSNSSTMENSGTIIVSGDAGVGNDGKPINSLSSGIAVIENQNFTNERSIRAWNGKVKNNGKINVSGGKGNTGMVLIVNAPDDITNDMNGTINVSSTKGRQNIAMRVDKTTNVPTDAAGTPKAINNGTINLDGDSSIGMVGTNADVVNNANKTIGTTSGKSIINGIGMATSGGTLTNNGIITLEGTGVSSNVGAYMTKKTGNPTGIFGSGSAITVKGADSTGVLITNGTLSYQGTTEAQGDGVTGLLVGDNKSNTAAVTVAGSGTVTVNGGNAATSAGVYENITTKVKKGSYGIVVGKGSSLVSSGSNNVNIVANVKGAESIGLYSGESATLEVGDHDVKAYDGAVNYDADKGKITLKGTGTATTGQKSLLFYLGEDGSGKVAIDGKMNATIEGGTTPNTRGNAFYYVGNGGNFGKTQIEGWAKDNFGDGTNTTLGNLTLNMNKGSRLFIAQNVGMDLSDTTGNTVSTATGAHINGTDYKTFMLYLSKLAINQDVNLDDATDAYNQLEISNSSITNANTKTITGTKANQVAMAQENNRGLYARNKVVLSNEGTINLSGAGSTGMYAKFGELYNKATGVMTIGDKSTAIYGIDDSLIENAGKITIGSNSTGLYSEGSTSQTIKNTGTIETTGNDSVAISYKPDAGLSSGTVLENTGKITMTGDRNTAVYATGTPGYIAKNSGIITLGDSASITSPNVGLYTDHNSVPLQNTGKIESGNNTIGVYGHNVENSGDLKIGNAAIGIYSQSGNVNLTGGTITTGTDEAVGVYTVGSGQTVTNSGTAFNIGNNSFGFVNVGTGNTITSSISNVGLGDNNVYMYSNDTAGTVTNSTKITSTGEQNYGIYSAGIIDYTSNAYGVAYVHEDETVRLGNSSGWYAGAVTNHFKFKDIGKSRENQTMIKAGVFKTMSPSFDHNGSLRWTIAGDVFAGRNEMKRRFLVVDDIFNAKADYTSYGTAFKTDLGYDVRLSERAHLRPYGALKMEYGRFTDIKEDSGEIRLEVDGNDYFSVKPEVGLEFKYVQPMALKTNLSVGLAAAYENELGRVANGKNKARVRYTEADWFGIRSEKEDRRGSGKFDLNVGVDNTRFGVTANLGYDTRGENIRGGLGFRLIY